MEYWIIVISWISQLNRTLAEYLAQNGWYLFYYFNFHNITDTLVWPVTMLVKHTPMPFWICEMEQWCIEFPYSKSKIWVKVGIDDKSTKREIHVLVTPIVHLSPSYDNSLYFCNKLHLWIPTLKKPAARGWSFNHRNNDGYFLIWNRLLYSWKLSPHQNICKHLWRSGSPSAMSSSR